MSARKPADAQAERGGASRSEYVRAKVREAIRAGRYRSGERIRETELAEWLGVSRTPVREALRRLESEGLLVFVPWRGVVVAELDRQQVVELYAMREVLEGTAARLAANHVREAEEAVLEELLDREATMANDPDELARINRRFHAALHAAAHNRYLVQMLDSLRNSLALLRGTTLAAPGRAESAHAEHLAILDAIKRRDPEAAEAAGRAHIRSAERVRLMMLEGDDA